MKNSLILIRKIEFFKIKNCTSHDSKYFIVYQHLHLNLNPRLEQF